MSFIAAPDGAMFSPVVTLDKRVAARYEFAAACLNAKDVYGVYARCVESGAYKACAEARVLKTIEMRLRGRRAVRARNEGTETREIAARACQ